jgi:hypothetical protein
LGNSQRKLFPRSASPEIDIAPHFDRPPVFKAAQTRVPLAFHEAGAEMPEKIVKPVETAKPGRISKLSAGRRHR